MIAITIVGVGIIVWCIIATVLYFMKYEELAKTLYFSLFLFILTYAFIVLTIGLAPISWD